MYIDLHFFMLIREKIHSDPQIIQIPDNVKKDIEERGFHLYKWISPDEVKLSVQRDFLKVIKIIWLPLAIISVLIALLSWLNIFLFFLSIILGVFGMFVYLIFLSIGRSMLLSKSAFVVITDSSISLWWKIHKLSEVAHYKKDIQEVSETFEEELFGKSWLSESKKSLTQEVLQQLFWGYEAIFNMTDRNFWNSKDSFQWILVLIAFYTLYILFMACVYFFWVLWLWIFWNIIVWLNTKYLIKKWEKVIFINSLFWEISGKSEEIESQKLSLKNLLIDAQNNQWKDGLLLAIKEEITQINSTAQDTIISVMQLKNTIQSSKYNQMFRFEVYNAWIKNQILSPLKEIQKLLIKNKIILISSQKEIQEQLKNTQKEEFISALKLSLTRVEMQLEEFERYIPQIEEFIKKLEA